MKYIPKTRLVPGVPWPSHVPVARQNPKDRARAKAIQAYLAVHPWSSVRQVAVGTNAGLGITGESLNRQTHCGTLIAEKRPDAVRKQVVFHYRIAT